MIIELVLESTVCDAALPIEVAVSLHDKTPLHRQVINLDCTEQDILIDVPMIEHTRSRISLQLSSSHINIIRHPIEIKKILLDQFFSLDSILYSGRPQFDQQFLFYAQKRNLYLDPTATCNRLDFTGRLIYDLEWPFYHNIWQHFRGTGR